MTRTNDLILELLLGAAEAHGIHEREDLGGVYDEAWPQWYAAHMTTAIEQRGLRLVPATEQR
ncbi:hypothetical protein ACWGJP_12750 [Microbacterium sp. NPDC055903]